MNYLYSQQQNNTQAASLDPAGNQVKKVMLMYKQGSDSEHYPYDKHQDRVEALATILGQKNQPTLETEAARPGDTKIDRDLSAFDFELIVSDEVSATEHTQMAEMEPRARMNGNEEID